jgi:hypothetical protein
VGSETQSRQRIAAGFTLLIATSYALYYLVSDRTHVQVSILHWALGFA